MKDTPVEVTVQQRALQRLSIALVALVILLVVGAAGYRFLEGMSFVDAVYMAVITISTVGFGEVQQLGPEGRLFTIALIVGGGGVAIYSLSSVAEFVLSGAWRAHWDHRVRLRMLAQLSNHIIVCGYGRVGRHVAHGLAAEKLPFVVVDRDPERIAHIEEMGYLALQGNAADEVYLREAGINRACGLVATANTDAENVFIVLTARGLRPDLLIVARANYEDSESKLLRAGADKVILPYSITGRRMVAALIRPDVADFLDQVTHTGGLELVLEQVRIAPTSSLVGQTLSEAQQRHQLGITVLACRLPGDHINTKPGAETVLRANAQIVALGTREQLQAMIRLAQE